MTPTLLEVMGGLAPQFEVLAQFQTIIAMVVILFFGGVNFNAWAGSYFEAKLNNPPRHYTTFLRYAWYALLYTLIIELVYIAFLITPGLYEVISQYFGVTMGKAAESETGRNNLPLWVLLFLITIVPNTPGLRKPEQWVRMKLHQKAFIPTEAEAMVNQFAMHPARFKADPKDVPLVMDAIRGDIPDVPDIARPDNRLEHLWFKISYLFRKIKELKEKREIIQYYSICEPMLKRCEEEYKILQLEIRSYFISKKEHNGNVTKIEVKYIEEKKEEIRKRFYRLLKELYKIICCGVLATQKTHQGRMDTFRHFGLQPDFSGYPQVYFDIILGCVFFTTLLTFATTLVFYFIKSDIITNMQTVLSWTVVNLFLQGASIIVAVFFYRWLSRRKALGHHGEFAAIVFGRLTDISIGALTGYLAGACIIIFYILMFSKSTSENIQTLIKNIWSWPMIPAATSGFIIYYLGSLDTERKRLAEGLIQGGTIGLVAALAYIISAGLRDVELNAFFLCYCILVCALTGFAIGWTFPEEYRERKKAVRKTPERRANPRISVFSEAILQIEDKKYPCQTIDLSLDGARLPTEIPAEVGTNVSLNLNDVGEIKGVVKRKEAGITCLQLFANGEIKKRLASYIGLFSTGTTGGILPEASIV